MDGTRRLASQLCAAVNNGDPRSVQLLLSKGASPNLVGRKGVAAIHLAVGRETEKNMRCLKMLLQHEADPNIRSSEGLTPLHVAAIWGCCQNLKVLLTNGGNPHMKDNEGNTPAKLAEQHDNKRCARLLQQYQFSSADTEEEEDFPHYQYSVCSDQTDMSGYPESDCSFSSCHVGLSSTRLSSLFNLSNINGRPSYRGASFAGPSVLSSTRISAARPAAPKEEVSCFEESLITKDNEQAAPDNGVISPSRMNAPPEFFSRRASRKSVSFLNVDEYFPVFSPKSPPEQSSEIIQCPDALPFDMAEYPDFLDSDRMASVLPQQGIDVTSPDHVFVFCRDSSESTEEDLEKTVIGHISLKLDDDEPEGQNNNNREPPVNPSERQEQAHLASSSSGTSGSHYSSCESDHYTSCLDPPVPPEKPVFPPVEGPQSDKRTKLDSTESENELLKGDDIIQAEPKTDSKPETTEPLSDLFHKLTMAEEQKVSGACSGSFSSAAKQLHVVRQDGEVSEETSALNFTPSPFVTGRTRSRLSRCSMRTSRTPESLSMASLFEDTLPMPVRTIRQTPRSHGSGRCFNSPYTPSYATESSERCAEGDSLPEESRDSQSGTLSGPSASNSQADTLILHKSLSDSAEGSQSLDDTVVLEKNQDNSIDAYVRNLAEIIRAVRGQNRDLSEDGEKTDDLTSSTEAKAEDPTAEDQAEGFHNDDVWVTEDSSSRSDSASSSSTSACFSPRRSTEDSDPPCTPGTGCTPRYSMSRLSSCHRPQRLANLSFTPGGRPVIQDLDEPTEYLYTDTEQGHKFIETHVPPTSDTSLSSGPSTSVCDETVLYDWRSLQTAMKSNKGKENQQPEEAAAQEEVPDKAAGKLLTDTRGMTDRELRLRLVELGESPGPISSRTRPTYLRRLCSLMQEENCRTQHPRKQSDHPQKDLGYSPELCRVLQTFQLPSSHDDEQTFCQQFDQPDQNRKWREGIIKSSFNYLLLDPRVTKNLPFRSHTITPQECFQTFIRAIFYVGKGKRSRPYSHLYEALEYYRGEKTAKKLCAKVQHILQVWAAEQGVISLHCFQNVIPVEAYTREACMVEAIGLKMLTNQKRGDFYGVVSTWELKRKRELGINLLYRAMQIFLAEGERQLRPADIRQ